MYCTSAMSQKEIRISTLSSKEQSIVRIASLTAIGNMGALTVELNRGLDNGLTIEEIKESMLQLYAYCGFPRSLNAMHKLIEVLDHRKATGKIDSLGKMFVRTELNRSMLEIGIENQTKLVGSKVSGRVYDFSPAIDLFLKEHLFGAIFSRDNLDWRTREIITISALAAMEGTESQLRSHFNVGFNNGLSVQNMLDISEQISICVNENRSIVAREVLKAVLEKLPYTPSEQSKGSVFSRGEKVNNSNFIGEVWLNQLIQSDSANTLQVGNVSFEPGARTKWHYHPAGQILLVLEGFGYYQELGSPKRLLKKGDVVKCPANRHHWHGATPTSKFVQTAITDVKNGTTIWLGAVSEEEYSRPIQ